MDIYTLVPLGFALIFIGVILMMAGSFGKGGNAQWGIGGFIGPIPFGFMNSLNALYTAVAISVIAFLAVMMRSKFLAGKQPSRREESVA
jgi:uncharacterized membrane protein